LGNYSPPEGRGLAEAFEPIFFNYFCLIMRNKAILLFIFGLSSLHAFCATGDSLFFKEVKAFFFKETGTSLNADLYATWKDGDEPYYYLYVSEKDTVKTPAGLKYPFVMCSSDSEASQKELEFAGKGYAAFIYKSYANSAGVMNKRLMSYRNESKSFIVFHEMVHKYIEEQHLKIPYEFNEALADVIGNYGTLELSKSSKNMDKDIVEDQIKINEKIYKCINSYVKKINSHPRKVAVLNARCEKRVQSILKKGDLFQQDRFDYKVNNGYLLKNKFYSENYFLLKKVLQNQKSIKEFMELIKYLPGDIEGCKKYLNGFT
jgi:hypothetical protein